MKYLLLVLVLASAAPAAETVQRAEDLAAVVAELAPDVSGRVASECAGEFCRISWTPAPGKTPAFTDRAAARAALVAELGAIEDKLDAGTATTAEMRRALKIILKLVRLSKAAP